ncbi:MAG: hypothetical protein O7D30_08930, partial [Rickettsia endosymbiont of Ixodes persulcatus]|nr:hypothetical protein [Rickettsia endosymbiont of Ixodes persulcatus]
FIQLTNLKKYYSVESIKVSNNRVRQFYGDINYQLAEHWIVGFGARIELMVLVMLTHHGAHGKLKLFHLEDGGFNHQRDYKKIYIL